MTKVKSPITYEHQVEKLRLRGCFIENEVNAIKILSNINYYRLSAYLLPFKEQDDSYSKGTNFNTIYRIYEFDRKLRSIIFSVIEEIEVYLRARLAYYHAHKYGALGYLDEKNYYLKHNHNDFLDKIETEKDKRKKEPFVKHHRLKYSDQFPVWVIIELFSFGMLSFFFSDLLVNDQKIIARSFFNTHHKTLKSWLKCCTDIRNSCAHFGRFYYKRFPSIPDGIPELDNNNNRSLFGAVMMLKSLYPDKKKWNNEIIKIVINLFDEYQKDIQLEHIGFPTDWKLILTK
ncbi:MAG: Abi family protein [Treponema sp.]|nr:Abi family protein [Treponema sp.]